MINDQHLIEQYLSENLNEDEQISFNQRLNDAAFRKSLMLTGVSLDILKEQSDKHFIEQLQQNTSVNESNTNYKLVPSSNLKDTAENPQIKQNETKRINPRTRLLKIAAIAAIFIFAALPFLLPENSQINELDRYFIPYPPVDFARGNNADGQETLKAALKQYINEDYASALKLFQNIEPTNDTLQLYAANCQMKLKDYQPAEQTLFKLTESMAENIRNNAEWYLFYTFLYQGKMDKAKMYYDAITKNPKQPFRNKTMMLKDYIK